MKVTRKVRRTARQLFRLCVVNGQLDPSRVRQVAERVAASGRRGSLAVLGGLSTDGPPRSRTRIEPSSKARLPCPTTCATSVQADLARRYGAGLETSFTENPALIAGMRIRVGSDVYDGSVRARLASIDAGL